MRWRCDGDAAAMQTKVFFEPHVFPEAKHFGKCVVAAAIFDPSKEKGR